MEESQPPYVGMSLTMAAQGDHQSLDTSVLNQLISTEARALLDAIVGLRELPLSETLDLPQLIIVGDQSSGNTALEAISRVRIPVNSNGRARFATEFITRRAYENDIEVSVNLNSVKTWRRAGVTYDMLPEVVHEAKEKMSLSEENVRAFSKDILRIEVSGPDIYPLKLVDLPCFGDDEIEEGEVEEGIQTANELAKKYMQQSDSIIMVVISRCSRFASHNVLEVIKNYDPARERTLGVIIKPDLSESNDKELRLVRGEDQPHHLSLGWHVLRNFSENERNLATEGLDIIEEDFFRSGSWSCIPTAHRGSQELRNKLSKVLFQKIQRKLPKLISDLNSMLDTKQRQLEALGKPRSTTEDLRAYLMDISDKMRRLTQDAVAGRYHNGFFGSLEDDKLKLRAQLRNLNSAFYMTLQTKGTSQVICPDSVDGENQQDHVGLFNSTQVPEHLEPFLDLYKFPDPELITESDFLQRLKRLTAANQGNEHPDVPNSDLMVQLLKSQAEPWRCIAEFHLKLTISFAKAFMESLVGHVVNASDKHTSEAILREIVDPFFDERDDNLTTKLDELLLPYTAGFPMPLDSEFRTGMSIRTGKRLTSKPTNSMDAGLDAASAASSEHQKTNKTIDLVQTAYEMSLRSFADNVVNLAIESCLVRTIPEIFTPKMAISMSNNRLRELAQESPEIQIERNTLAREMEKLRDGLRQCRLHRPRESTVLPSTLSRRSSAKHSVLNKAAVPSSAVKPSTITTNSAPPATLAAPAQESAKESTPKPNLLASLSQSHNPFPPSSTQPAARSLFAQSMNSSTSTASQSTGVPNPSVPKTESQPTSGALFGTSAVPLFGSSNGPPFGSSNGPLFGSSNGPLFGSSNLPLFVTPKPSVSTATEPEVHNPFAPRPMPTPSTVNSVAGDWKYLVEPEPNNEPARNRYISIIFLDEYRKFSTEEVRLQDYVLTSRA